ncbi:MAG: AraC family ligand binding domain-containing protein, partial [Oscillospiraceae bacterium]
MEDRNKKEEFSLFDNNIPVSIKQYKTTGEELCFDLHWHEKAEILAVNQGALHAVTGGNLLTVKKGQILFVNPCELHSAKSDSGGVQYDCIIIEPNFFVSLNMDACDKALVDFQNMSIKISNIISDKRMFAIIRKAINEYNKKSPNFELFVRAHLLLFMSEALRGHVN